MKKAADLSAIDNIKADIEKNSEIQKTAAANNASLLKKMRTTLAEKFPVSMLIGKPKLRYKLQWGYSQPKMGAFKEEDTYYKHHDVWDYQEVLNFLEQHTDGWGVAIDMQGLKETDKLLVLAEYCSFALNDSDENDALHDVIFVPI